MPGHAGLMGSYVGFCFLLWEMGSHCHVGIKKEVLVNGTVNLNGLRGAWEFSMEDYLKGEEPPRMWAAPSGS